MIVLERLREYCENSTIHGLRYMTEKGRHFIERIFWLAAVCTSTAYMYIFAAESWDHFVTHHASFVTDTNYLEWNTSFPSVTFCERMQNNPRVVEYMEKNDLDTTNLFLYVSTVNDRPDDCSYCRFCTNICPEMSMKMINGTRASCKELFAKCLWNDKEFDCCANFMPLMTELGPCFSINSLLARPKPIDPKVIELTSNRNTGPGTMRIITVDPVDVYLHGPEDVPYRNHPKEMTRSIEDPAMAYVLLFKMVEIDNDPGLRSLSVERRECRFRDEPLPNSSYPIYSYSTCIVECRMRKQIELCNCTTIFMPHSFETPLCNAQQLSCLFFKKRELSSIKSPWKKLGRYERRLACNCPIGCSEQELTHIWSELTVDPDPDRDIEVTIKLAYLPSERFRRNVVTTKLDLVVSLGGTAGLFLGASLVSGFEVVIFLVFRFCKSRRETASRTPSSARDISVSLPLELEEIQMDRLYTIC